jgi:hypothetical protein
MTIETLTDAERNWPTPAVVGKAIRIIDAQAAALAEARAECERLRGESATRLAYSEQWRTEALSSRAKLAAVEAEAEKTLRQDYQRAAESVVCERARANAAESKLAAAEAECKRLRARGDETYDRLMAVSDRQSQRADAAEDARHAAESKLAAAEALLRERPQKQCLVRDLEMGEGRVDAFLGNQSAVPKKCR